MIFRVHYSPAARSDLTSVWKGVFAASKSFDTADKYTDELMDKIGKKADFPYSGIPLCYRGLFTGFYSVNYKAYKAFYRVTEKKLEVIRILPIKMDYIRVLFPEIEQEAHQSGILKSVGSAFTDSLTGILKTDSTTEEERDKELKKKYAG